MNTLPVWRPTSAEQVREAVLQALQSNTTLEIIGTGTRRGFGTPVRAQVTLDMSALRGVLDYQPEELVITLTPGTPMSELQALLDARRQMLAFEPPDFGPLWGLPAGHGTLGGCMMIGRGGARRLTAGAPRDHCLGVKAVNGFGECFAAGGRVVKNVTGFDLPKLLTGSCGTLCVVTELTLKVMPAPEDCATLMLAGLADDAAVRLMSRALGSTAQCSSAAHLPQDVAGHSAVPAVANLGAAATLLRLEGTQPSVAARLQQLRQEVQANAALSTLDRNESLRAWREVSDAGFFAGTGDAVVWKLSVPPAAGAVVGRAVCDALRGRCYYDWGGGGVWMELPAAVDAHADAVRGQLRAAGSGGHATLMRAPGSVRDAVPPLQPLSSEELRVTRAVKAQFDPRNLFNPGRMGWGH